MRIAMVSDNVLPTPVDGWGGLQRVIWDLTEELHRRGHDITLFGCEGSYASGPVVITTPPAPSWQGESAHTEAVVEAMEGMAPFDVIHDSGHLGLLAVLHPDWPILRHSHDDSAVADTNLVLPSFALKHKHALAAAKVVYNAVDTSFWDYQETGHGDYFLYMGVVSKRKGVDIAARAAQLARVPLIIAGKTDWDQEFFDRELSSLIDGQTVRFIGPVQGEEKRELLRHARALLLLSRHCEPGALSVLEAQALGTPCIVSPNGCLPEYVEHGVAGVVCNGVQEVARAFARVETLSRTEIAARAHVEFAIARMADHMEVLYREIAAGRHWVSETGKPPVATTPDGHPKDACIIVEGSEVGAMEATLLSLVDNTYMGWYALVGTSAELEGGVWADPHVRQLDGGADWDWESQYGRFIMRLSVGEVLRRRELVLLVRAMSQYKDAAGVCCDGHEAVTLWRQPGPPAIEGRVQTIEYAEISE